MHRARQNGQRFTVMYLLYGGSDLLAATQAVARGDRTEIQKQRDRQITGERQAGLAQASEIATLGCRGKWQVYFPQADAHHSQGQVRSRAGEGVPARYIPERRARYTSFGGRSRQTRHSLGKSQKSGCRTTSAPFQQFSSLGRPSVHALCTTHTLLVARSSYQTCL